MGQFNDNLLENLALTVDPQNNDSMEVYGKLGKLGFDVDGLFDVQQFHNAIFKVLMLRAIDQYKSTGQGTQPEKNRHVTVSLTLNLRSPVVHSDQQLVEHGIVASPDEARNLREVIPVVDGMPGDSPAVQGILDLINSGQISLACN